ncbi:pimeloyl-ACP methyl ester carboxylesterase [Hephaestia caeni]|uniref:Proline iminopeptidase n=1 Tax=Hephaestia caeni TaxID=645617 RepID=A0A397P4Y5_9SPHN|nr:alpha/beta hydrolase [Hephaestia caeni]RIA44616.1 pimeloyl-ACP methyl ester carboxylesterase [Hephaestia caeni]
MRLTVLLFAIAVALPAQAQSDRHKADAYAQGREIIADIDKIVTPDGIQETFTATLGGAPQVINVRGADRDNPLLLFIHGGPGSVEMPIAWSFQRPWEDYFAVVQWDQRGAGRSYRLIDPEKLAPTLSVDRYRDDAIALIELLRRKYGKRKVVLVGHSWGSAIGLAVAAKRPDLISAYVGIGQLIDVRENERLGFAWTLARAKADDNQEAVAELEGIRPYPGPGALDVKKLQIERKWSIRYGALAAYREDAAFYFNAAALSPEYAPADIEAIDDGSELAFRALFPQLVDLSFLGLTRVDVPVFLFLGRHDHTCDSALAARWLGKLDSPEKKIVWFEHSAHLPMLEQPGRVLTALVDDVRPLATP